MDQVKHYRNMINKLSAIYGANGMDPVDAVRVLHQLAEAIGDAGFNEYRYDEDDGTDRPFEGGN